MTSVFDLFEQYDESKKALAFIEAEYKREKEKHQASMREAEEELIKRATETSASLNGFGYVVRWTQGREVRTLDADSLYPNLSEEVKKVAYKVKVIGNPKVLFALRESGAIDAETFDKFVEITPANPRWILE